MTHALTSHDRERLDEHGIEVSEVERQLALFRDPPPPLHLARPCAVGSGILQLSESQRESSLRAYELARAAGRFVKFVPASGAASRMFSSLLEVLENEPPTGRAELAARAVEQPAAADTLQLFDQLERFAFRDALAEAFERADDSLDDAVRREDVRAILEVLATARGLDYANQPKGLVAFHRYAHEVRTPFEEHLVEASTYAASDGGRSRLHFTVSPEHRAGFELLANTVRERYESRHAVRFEIDWSSQMASTNTVALGADGQLFRTASGDLLLRPGGHGALLENLNQLQADVVLIKNIDNVTTEDNLAETVLWKKLLAGHLCAVQSSVFAHLRAIRSAPAPEEAIAAARRYVRDELRLELPPHLAHARGEELAVGLRVLLNRPIRVCGMVQNTGEPGGGPAWVRDADGGVSPQVVERAQIDAGSEQQQRLFNALTHFSPVDFACGVRDVDGKRFDLRKFVDPDAVIFADKTSEGRALRALEHPGLWNGGMARWLTLFVEVPLSTFNPVKTFLDLLRPAHQPRAI